MTNFDVVAKWWHYLARGEDLSLYHIPRGLRQLALSFKKTLSKNADDDDDDEDDNAGPNILK